MARFQEIEARNDQRPAAGRENFMGHLKNSLDSSATDLPEGARSPRHVSRTRYPSRGRNGRRTSTSCSWRPCSSMAVAGVVSKST